MTDVTRLIAIEDRGFAWSIGRGKMFRRECRIWPRNQSFTAPHIIEGGLTFEEAIDAALIRLGDQVPYCPRGVKS